MISKLSVIYNDVCCTQKIKQFKSVTKFRLKGKGKLRWKLKNEGFVYAYIYHVMEHCYRWIIITVVLKWVCVCSGSCGCVSCLCSCTIELCRARLRHSPTPLFIVLFTDIHSCHICTVASLLLNIFYLSVNAGNCCLVHINNNIIYNCSFLFLSVLH